MALEPTRLRGVGLLLALWLLAAPLARAESPPPLTPDEQRLLEEALAADAPVTPAATASTPPAAVQSMNPNLALILDVALAWFNVADPLQAGGHDPRRTGVTLQQLEMHLDASVDPYFRLDANIVFTLFGVEVEEAFGTTLGLPWGLQVRAGLLLNRFGRLNARHPHSRSFVDQALVHGRLFGGEGSRGLGVEVSWLTPLPWYVEVVAATTHADGACCARSFYGSDGPAVDGPEDLLYTLAVKQFFPLGEDWSLAWGLSAQLGPNPTGPDNRSELYGTDLYLRWRRADDPDRMALSITVEALARTRQVPGAVLQDWGVVAEAVWSIDPNWELGARYDYLSPVGDVLGDGADWLDDGWAGDRHRGSLQATWLPSHFARLRAQANADVPGDRDPIWGLMLALELVIGAHGPHSY